MHPTHLISRPRWHCTQTCRQHGVIPQPHGDISNAHLPSGRRSLVRRIQLTPTRKSDLRSSVARLGHVASAVQIARAGEDTGREHLRLMVRSLPERESLNYAVSRPKALDLILSLVRTVPGTTATALDAVIAQSGACARRNRVENSISLGTFGRPRQPANAVAGRATALRQSRSSRAPRPSHGRLLGTHRRSKGGEGSSRTYTGRAWCRVFAPNCRTNAPGSTIYDARCPPVARSCHSSAIAIPDSRLQRPVMHNQAQTFPRTWPL